MSQTDKGFKLLEETEITGEWAVTRKERTKGLQCVFWRGRLCVGGFPGTAGGPLDSQSPAGQGISEPAEGAKPPNPLEVQSRHLHRRMDTNLL